MRDFLRSLPVFAGVIRDFDTDALPEDPAELFDRSLREAVEEGVSEPHAMTLSTSVRGPVLTGSADLSAADVRSRGSSARAVALAGHESQPLTDRATCAQAVADAERELAAQPDLVPPSWQVCAVGAHTVEFWQADKDRQHARVQYRRSEDSWKPSLLWP